jgi:deazaflavin-dependent oxidoreductase (nitroreductase family)
MTLFASRLLRLLLVSPLHGLVSRRLMLLTVIGRHTGRRYTFPVRYATDGHTVTVVAGSADHKTWWLNLVHAAPVVMRIGGCTRNGIAHVVWDAAEADRALAGYSRVYPLSAPRRSVVALEEPAGGGVAVATMVNELRTSVIVRIAPTVDI